MWNNRMIRSVSKLRFEINEAFSLFRLFRMNELSMCVSISKIKYISRQYEISMMS